MALPDQRADLADALVEMHGRNLATDGDDVAAVARRLRDVAAHVRAAELYWVSDSMARVALDASADLPDWTPAAALPTPIGMLVWERPLPLLPVAGIPSTLWPRSALGVPQQPKAPVSGVLWVQTGGTVRVTVLSRRSDLVDLTDWLVIPERAAVWPSTMLEDFPADALYTAASMRGTGAGFVSMLATTWLLMQQPTVATPRRVTPTQRGASRLPSGALTGVSIIDLRRLDVVRDGADPDHPGRVYRHRWVVRGHWRQQPYGPGRTQRRPTWVPSYVKGPDGAPLLATEHVNVWRR